MHLFKVSSKDTDVPSSGVSGISTPGDLHKRAPLSPSLRHGPNVTPLGAGPAKSDRSVRSLGDLNTSSDISEVSEPHLIYLPPAAVTYVRGSCSEQ